MITYTEIDKISESAKSYIALASVPGYSKPVILKKLSPENASLYTQIQMLSNEHIVQIYASEIQDRHLILAEEYIDGVSLDSYIKEKHLRQNEIVSLLLQLCDGLKALHQAVPPIIHRDIKPSNIMVTADGTVKIIDFDASRNFKPKRTQDTVIMGTLEYAPPEQYGFSQTDVRSDIYSVGAMMYELFFHQTLPDRKEDPENTEDLNENIFHLHKYALPYRSTHAADAALLQIISQCTMFDPNKRYHDIDQLIHALQHYKTYRLRRRLYKIIPAALILLAAGSVLFLPPVRNLSSKKAENTTPAASVRPTPTPYDGPVTEYFIDYSDETTAASENVILYFLKSDPAQTPVYIQSGALEGLTPDSISLQDSNSYRTQKLSDNDWHVDPDGYIVLHNDFLQTLIANTTYHLSIDYISASLGVDLRAIETKEYAFKQKSGTLMPGWYNYYLNQPADAVIHLVNMFGRKVTDIKTGNGKSLPKKYWTLKNDTTIVFSKELFKDHFSRDYINYHIYHEVDKSLSDQDYLNLNISVLERPYEAPVFEKYAYILKRSQMNDLVLPVQWNDGLNHLASITPRDGKAIKEKYIKTDDHSITISKKYFENVKNGSYIYYFEFGARAILISITIAD